MRNSKCKKGVANNIIEDDQRAYTSDKDTLKKQSIKMAKDIQNMEQQWRYSPRSRLVNTHLF